MKESFVRSTDTEVNASVIISDSSFHEVRKQFDYKSNKCFFKTKIKFKKYEILDNKRNEKDKKKYNGQKVKFFVELEILETLTFPNGLTKKNNYEEKRLMESEMIYIKKNGDSVQENKYLTIINQKNIYWKKEKKPKLFERFLNEVDQLAQSSIMDHYNMDTMNQLGLNSSKATVIYEIKNIPCDIQLPIVKMVNSYINIKEKQIAAQNMFCLTSNKSEYFLGASFVFDISFLNKYHLQRGADYFWNYYLKNKSTFNKFKSIPYKTQIE